MTDATSPYTPSQSVVAGGAGGAVSMIIVWLIGLKVAVPSEIAIAISTAVSAALAYFFKGGRSIHTIPTEPTK